MQDDAAVQDGDCWAPPTPIVDALSCLAAKPIRSFHALPIYHKKLTRSGRLASKYKMLRDLDASFSGQSFDTFFFADGVIRDSELLAAEAFGADGALFVTTGTTTSNQIALHAMFKAEDKVLVERHSHQSLHFTLDLVKADVVHLFAAWSCAASERAIWSLEDLLAKVQAADDAGRAFDLIVLSGSSYDGMAIDVPATVRAVRREIGPRR